MTPCCSLRGMLPFSDRKQAILQAHERVRLAKYGGLSGGKAVDSVIQGSRVCLRSSPIYSVGTRAIHIQGGKVQCGILQESVFSTSLSEKCRFRVICEGEEEDMEVEKEEEAAARLGELRCPLMTKTGHTPFLQGQSASSRMMAVAQLAGKGRGRRSSGV